MKNYFLILALFCLTAFWSCEKDESDLLSTDGTEQNGGSGNEGDENDDDGENNGEENENGSDNEENGDDSEDSEIPKNMELAFPDPIFRAYVLKNFDTDGDGKISEKEALDVTYINVINYNNIKSLDGIQYFTNLTYLDCSTNELTSLDISKNTALTGLYCDYNKLTSLDVSKNTALEYLNCYNNQIEELDLSKTNLVNSISNSVSYIYGPLDCAPMSTLKKVYLKKGWSIKYITEDRNRSSDYIPDHTEIVFVD